MKKRLISLLLILVFLLAEGCSIGSDTTADGGNLIEATFFYEIIEAQQMDGEDLVQSEERKVSIYSLEDLLNLYFDGPVSKTLVSPFPDGTHVVSIDQENSNPVLTMSGEYFTLTGINLSLASCCLAKTVCAYMNSDRIIVQDELERIRLEIDPDSYELHNNLNSDETSVYTIYFADSDYRYLHPEYREVSLSDSESAESYVLDQLLRGPEDSENRAIAPQNTRVLDISVQDSVCIVDFSDEIQSFDDNFSSAYLFVFSVVNTLTELDGISYVQFEINGTVPDALGGLALNAPVSRYTDAIGPVYTAAGETDANLYVQDPSGTESFMMPIRVKQTITQSLAEAVITAAVQADPPCSLINPIPYGTKVLSVSVSETVCYLDISADVIPQDDTEKSEKDIVVAIVSELTNLDSVNSVVLTIDGESSGLQYIDLSKPLTVSSLLEQ